MVFGGLLLGSFKYKGFSLGSSGVFFVGFILGCLGLVTSKYITTFGLIIFMYTLGIQAGPSFFNSISRKGIPYIIIAVSVSFFSIISTLVTGNLFKLSPGDMLGIYTGSLTSSSSLAILMEIGWGKDILPSYGVVYPIGLVSVIIFIQAIPSVFKKDLITEFKKISDIKDQGEATHLISRKFMVENPKIIGKQIKELNLGEDLEATISRLRRRGKIIIPGDETVLKLRDVILVVGSEEALEKIHILMGNETHDDMEIDPGIEARQILITNPSLHHVSIDHLGISKHYHAVITRIYRSGMELAPVHDFIIELGDSILAVGKKNNIDRLARFLGRRERTFAEVDLISMAFGIALGIIIGNITIPIPYIGYVTAGISGGSLIVGLFLGYIRRLGFLTGQMSPSAKIVIKELGLCLFLSGIGASAGFSMTDTNTNQILLMILCSVIVLLFTMTSVFLIAYKILKMDFIKSITCLCGGMVSTPALGTLTSILNSDKPTYIFAACYPLSLFGCIVSSQILAMILR